MNPVREQIRPLGSKAASRHRAAAARPRLANQLEEVLTEFWFNHFKRLCRQRPGGRWWPTTRPAPSVPHVLGRFRDLLGATAKHPPCCSTWTTQSVAPGFKAARQ